MKFVYNNQVTHSGVAGFQYRHWFALLSSFKENYPSHYLQSSFVECRKLQKPPDIWPPRTWHSLCPGQLRGPRQVLLPCAGYSGLVQECQGSAEREILVGLTLESTDRSSSFREHQHKPCLFLITWCNMHHFFSTFPPLSSFKSKLVSRNELLSEMIGKGFSTRCWQPRLSE